MVRLWQWHQARLRAARKLNPPFKLSFLSEVNLIEFVKSFSIMFAASLLVYWWGPAQPAIAHARPWPLQWGVTLGLILEILWVIHSRWQMSRLETADRLHGPALHALALHEWHKQHQDDPPDWPPR